MRVTLERTDESRDLAVNSQSGPDGAVRPALVAVNEMKILLLGQLAHLLHGRKEKAGGQKNER